VESFKFIQVRFVYIVAEVGNGAADLVGPAGLVPLLSFGGEKSGVHQKRGVQIGQVRQLCRRRGGGR